MRKYRLVNGEFYHIFTKSIAGFNIFRHRRDYHRMISLMKYYQIKDAPMRYSNFIKLCEVTQEGFDFHIQTLRRSKKKLVEIIAFCLMPTHVHFALKQVQNGGISKFMKIVLNSYTRYFNVKHDRKGPLWQGRFQNVLVKDEQQLLHLTRYIHLNPTTANLVPAPEKWEYSSYREYINHGSDQGKINVTLNEMGISAKEYKKEYKNFIDSRINDQKELAKFKHLILE